MLKTNREKLVCQSVIGEITSPLGGINPYQMARDMTSIIDNFGIARANMIARTEIVNAFAETTLDRFDYYGVEEVDAMAEFSTSADDLVCDYCLDLEGRVLTIEEARGIIPMHPNCRCTWLPVPPYTERAIALI